MSTLLRVDSDQIEKLIDSPKRAVDLVRDLLWAEAMRQGINPFSISVSDRIYAKDGGVDGTTIDISPSKEGLLFHGTTYYQIKWGETFDPRDEAKAKAELLTKQENLKSKLRDLAKNKGTYVLVWFGGSQSFAGNDDEVSTNIIRTVFANCGYSNVNTIVLDSVKIAEACSQYPFIQSTYFNPLTEYFLTLEDWINSFPGRNDQKSRELPTYAFQRGDLQAVREAMTRSPQEPIQLISHNDDGRCMFHRWLVYEALRVDGCKQRTICQDADNLVPPLSDTIKSRADLNQILVVDNCKRDHHKKILSVLGQRTERLGLIMISTDGAAIGDGRFHFYGQRGFKDSSFLREISSRNRDEIFTLKSQTTQTEIPQQRRVSLPDSVKKS